MRALVMAAIAVLATITPVSAQDSSPTLSERLEAYQRGCRDDDGNDRCSPEAHDRMRALYGLESAEDLLARGVTMRRAMFVDGYGNDVAAITFWREPGMAPMVEVRSPRVSEREEPQPLRAAISGETWAEVLYGSTYFDRELAPPPAQAAGPVPGRSRSSRTGLRPTSLPRSPLEAVAAPPVRSRAGCGPPPSEPFRARARM